MMLGDCASKEGMLELCKLMSESSSANLEVMPPKLGDVLKGIISVSVQVEIITA